MSETVMEYAVRFIDAAVTCGHERVGDFGSLCNCSVVQNSGYCCCAGIHLLRTNLERDVLFPERLYMKQ